MNPITQDMKSWLMLLVVVLVWASSFIFIKVGLQEISPTILAVLRFTIASITLLPILPVIGGMSELRRAPQADWLRFVVLGVSGVTLLNLLQFIGLSYTTAINGSVLLNTNPIFISILSLVLLHEKIGLKNVFGIFMALIGIIVIIAGDEFSLGVFSSSTFLGDLLVLSSAVCWAIYTVLGKSMFSRYNSVAVTIISITVGTAFLLVFASITEDFSIVAQISIKTWVIILYLALVCSGLAYLFWYEALKHLDASRAGAFLFTMPVYTILISHLTIGEPITNSTIAATALILLGVCLAEKA